MIDRRLYEIIKRILDESSIEQYPEQFSTRIIIQKILYLLTHGVSSPQLELSYKWNFYLYGPYSPDISQMIYHMNEVLEEIPNKDVKMKDGDQAAIEHLKDFKKDLEKSHLDEPDLQNLTDSELFEVIATLTYLANQIGANKLKVQKSFKKFKPELEEKISDGAYNSLHSLLKEYGYI